MVLASIVEEDSDEGGVLAWIASHAVPYSIPPHPIVEIVILVSRVVAVSGAYSYPGSLGVWG